MWVGERVLQRYRDASGDNAPVELLQFYQSYRACVRAKVSAADAHLVVAAAVEDDTRRHVAAGGAVEDDAIAR